MCDLNFKATWREQKRRYEIGCTVLATCEEHVAMHDVGSGGVEWTLKIKQLALRKMGWPQHGMAAMSPSPLDDTPGKKALDVVKVKIISYSMFRLLRSPWERLICIQHETTQTSASRKHRKYILANCPGHGKPPWVGRTLGCKSEGRCLVEWDQSKRLEERDTASREDRREPRAEPTPYDRRWWQFW